MEQPELSYPREWEYRIIGDDRDGMQRAIAAAVEGLEHKLSEGNSKGKYLSISLTLIVQDQEQRDRIFQGLVSRDHVRMVL